MIPTVPCDTPEACCESLYAVANHLLTEVYDALLTCYPTENCEPLAAYVTLGLGNDGIPDALTVAATAIDPSPSSRPGIFGIWRANFAIILKESGWPTAHVEGNEIILPSPVLQAAASSHVYAMGEAMHRKLANLFATKSLTPSGSGCTNATFNSMFPLTPQGGIVGWQASVTTDLPWN